MSREEEKKSVNVFIYDCLLGRNQRCFAIEALRGKTVPALPVFIQIQPGACRGEGLTESLSTADVARKSQLEGTG
ncbi:Hypothetical predicted protein [Xyrichtys novacula]|uniref:Uncharacterized protein n=1 Tax=Xyrichtys novacula TaxID=13765 RepID=A0AAV1HA22_XYRNO|nr:Hypothetical predicted protein [Xyrichtys novacula]